MSCGSGSCCGTSRASAGEQDAGPDPYLGPASGVLRNLLGIIDPGELARAEATVSASRLIDLERRCPAGTTLDHLRAFHRYIPPSGRSSHSSSTTPGTTSTG